MSETERVMKTMPVQPMGRRVLQLDRSGECVTVTRMHHVCRAAAELTSAGCDSQLASAQDNSSWEGSPQILQPAWHPDVQSASISSWLQTIMSTMLYCRMQLHVP